MDGITGSTGEGLSQGTSDHVDASAVLKKILKGLNYEFYIEDIPLDAGGVERWVFAYRGESYPLYPLRSFQETLDGGATWENFGAMIGERIYQFRVRRIEERILLNELADILGGFGFDTASTSVTTLLDGLYLHVLLIDEQEGLHDLGRVLDYRGMSNADREQKLRSHANFPATTPPTSEENRS